MKWQGSPPTGGFGRQASWRADDIKGSFDGFDGFVIKKKRCEENYFYCW